MPRKVLCGIFICVLIFLCSFFNKNSSPCPPFQRGDYFLCPSPDSLPDLPPDSLPDLSPDSLPDLSPFLKGEIKRGIKGRIKEGIQGGELKRGLKGRIKEGIQGGTKGGLMKKSKRGFKGGIKRRGFLFLTFKAGGADTILRPPRHSKIFEVMCELCNLLTIF